LLLVILPVDNLLQEPGVYPRRRGKTASLVSKAGMPFGFAQKPAGFFHSATTRKGNVQFAFGKVLRYDEAITRG